MARTGEYLNKLLDYLGWLYTRWYFWVLFIPNFLIRLPYGSLRSTPGIIYLIHLIDALILVTLILSIIIGFWRYFKFVKKRLKGGGGE